MPQYEKDENPGQGVLLARTKREQAKACRYSDWRALCVISP